MNDDGKRFGQIALYAWVTVIAVILFFVIFSNKCNAQPNCASNPFRSGLGYYGLRHFDHSLGITFQSVDQGIGIRYNQYITKQLGFYGSVSLGDYDVYGVPTPEIPHYKFVLGPQYRIDVNNRVKLFMTAGLSNHQFWGTERLDVYGGKYKTYDAADLYRMHDTILFKELISYPTEK